MSGLLGWAGLRGSEEGSKASLSKVCFLAHGVLRNVNEILWKKGFLGQVNLASSALNKSKQRIVGFLRDFDG